MSGRRLGFCIALSALALATGCSGPAPAPTSPECEANESRVCLCAGSAIGAQTCNADRSGFGECDCTAPAKSCSAPDAPHCRHGVCDTSTGIATCLCDDGYTGALCATCDAAHQDNDGDGTCAPRCAASDLSCGPNGACADTTGAPACVCNQGYAGPACDTCAPSHQDNDHDGSCKESCATAALTCSGHGSCDDVSGTAECACTAEYTGPGCDSCADGFQDFDDNGTCEPTCSQLDCGAHGACSDATGTAICGCVPGYALDGGTCGFSGIVRDPSFDNGSDWTTSSGAFVDPSMTGGLGAGVLPNGTCSAELSQQVTLPSWSSAEPMSLSLTRFVNCGNLCPAPEVTARVGGAFAGRVPSGAPGRSTLCLGESAYGATGTLSVTQPATCSPSSSSVVGIDDVTIAPDPLCPLPGPVANGDFEPVGGWSTTGGATFENGVGVLGSRGARLRGAPTVCQNGGGISAPISIPLAMTAPAIRFHYSLTGGNGLEPRLDGWPLSALGDTGGAFVTATACLPRGARGSVFDLGFILTPLGTSGACVTGDARDAIVDDVTLVDDPSCPGDLPSPGFERPDLATGWSVTQPSVNGSPAGSTKIEAGAGRNGTRGLHLLQTNPCANSFARTVLMVPPSSGASGPALKYWYRTQGTTGSLSLLASTSVNLPPAATWTQRTECLRPTASGQLMQLTVSLSVIGTCANAIDAQAFLDDFDVTTDPSCPAQ